MTVKAFFGEMDRFLGVQFEYARGKATMEDVVLAEETLVNQLQNSEWTDPEFARAKIQWLAILSGFQVNLGLTSLTGLAPTSPEIEMKLERARESVNGSPGFSKIVAEISRYTAREFDPRGLALETMPEIWLRDSDVTFDCDVDPDNFSRKILSVAGEVQESSTYRFFQSKNDQFFMMALHTTPAYFIGHGRLNSLFRLSTFAHEVGHTTTKRELDLEKSFLSFAEENFDKPITSDEMDSYRFERLFLQNLPILLEGASLDHSDWSERLLKRKAIQNNLHLLKNKMNAFYFGGKAFSEIEDSFIQQMSLLYSGFRPEGRFQWLGWATLAQPLSRVGYLNAYQAQFL